MALTTDYKQRKDTPIGRGVFDYFPDALAEVAIVSRIGNDQHNPGEPLNWAYHKSTDHWDCMLRHGVDRGTMDTDGARHSGKVAWRALAMLQIEIMAEKGDPEACRQLAFLGSPAQRAAYVAYGPKPKKVNPTMRRIKARKRRTG